MRTPAAWRWGSRCRPTWRCRRSSRSAPRSRSGSGPRRRSPGRRSCASGSPSRTPARTWPGSGRARSSDGDEYVINGSKTFITNGHRADLIVLVTKTDPDAGHDGFTLFLVPMDLPGVIREKRLREARHARLRHGAARLPGRPRPRVRGPRRGRQGLLPHHVGAPGRAADRRRRRVAGAQHVFDARSSTPRSARRSAARSATSR